MPDSDKKVARRVSFAVAELLMEVLNNETMATPSTAKMTMSMTI